MTLGLHDQVTKQLIRFQHRGNLIGIFDGLSKVNIEDIPKLPAVQAIQLAHETVIKECNTEEELTSFLKPHFHSLVKVKLLFLHIGYDAQGEIAEDLLNLLGLRSCYGTTTVVGFSKEVDSIRHGFKKLVKELDNGYKSVTRVLLYGELIAVEGSLEKPEMSRKEYDAILSDPLGSILSSEDNFDPNEFENIGFLDIDGVLQHNRTFLRTNYGGALATHFLKNPWKSVAGYDQELLAFLSKLSYKVGIKWVLSSSQRHILKGDDLKMWAMFVNLPVVDITGVSDSRGEEIKDYISRHPFQAECIVLDDEIPLNTRFPLGVLHIKVCPKNGVTYSQMESIAEHFKVNINELLGRGGVVPDWLP